MKPLILIMNLNDLIQGIGLMMRVAVEAEWGFVKKSVCVNLIGFGSYDGI